MALWHADRTGATLVKTYFHVGACGMSKKTTRITIETERVLTVRCGSWGHIWCEQCAADTEIVTLEAVGKFTTTGPAQVQQWLDQGELHWSQSPQGSVRICVRSLMRLLGTGNDG
jgi:hypothetical protein